MLHLIMTKNSKSRRKFTSKFKTKVALEAIRERQTLSELAKKYEIHATQISTWKKTLLEGMEQVFEHPKDKDAATDMNVDTLYNKIGRLEMERDFLKKSLAKLGWTTS